MTIEDGINIEIRDRINDSIIRKIRSIGSAAQSSHGQILKLKKALNFGGLNLGLRGTGLSNISSSLVRIQTDLAKLDALKQKSAVSQEKALNQIIASEERAIQASNRRVAQEVINEQKIRQESSRTAAKIVVDNQRIAQARLRTQKAIASKYTSGQIGNSRLAAQKVREAEIIKRESAKSAAAIASSNASIAASNIRVLKSQASLTIALNSASASEAKLAKAGLAAAAAQNKLAAAQAAVLTPTRVIAASYTNLNNRQIKAAINANNLAISNNDLRLSNIAVRMATTQAATALNNYSISVARSTSAAKLAANANRRLATSGIAVGTTLGRGITSLARFESGLYRVSQGARSVLSGILLLGTAGALGSSIDTYRDLQNQLRQTTESQTELNTLTEEIFGIAQRARAPLEGLANFYRRIDESIKNMGESATTTTKIVENVVKLLSASGSTPTERQSVRTQLADIFAYGKVQGREFQTLSKEAPRFMKALAEAIDVPISKLQELRVEGKLTAKDLATAIINSSEEIDAIFAKTPRTVGAAFTQLKNQIQFGFGKFADESGLIDYINGLADSVKNNLPTVANGFRALGATLLTLTAIGAVAWLVSLASGVGGLFFAVAAGIGYFTFFSKEINIAGTETGTLSDLVVVLKNRITELIDETTGSSLSDFFSAKGANQSFSNILAILDTIGESLIAVYAGVKLVKEGFSALGSGSTIFSESFISNFGIYLLKSGTNAIVELAAMFTQAFLSAVEVIFDAFTIAGHQASASLFKLLSKAPGFGALGGLADDIQANGVSKALEQQIDVEGLTNKIRDLKLDTTTNVQEMSEQWDLFGINVTASVLKMGIAYSNLKESLLELTQAQSEARIEQEKARQAAGATDPNSLRGFDPEQAARYRQELEAMNQETQKATDAQSQFFLQLSPLTDSALQQFGFTRDAINQTAQATDQAKQSIKAIPTEPIKAAADSFNSVDQRARSAGQTISTSISSGARSAQASIAAMANNAISSLNAIENAARSAAAAVASVGGVSVPVRSAPTPGQGFASGGYTGDVGRSQIAGYVHGQEFVMPADQTRQFRPLLETMRSGGNVTASSGSGKGINVEVHNYGSSNIEVQRLSPTDVRIIAREEADRTLNTRADSVVATHIQNPNSKTSRLISQSTSAKRRR